jgi:hypothetical protein
MGFVKQPADIVYLKEFATDPSRAELPADR